jgi:integrase
VALLVNSLSAQGIAPANVYDLAKSVFRYATMTEPPIRAGNPAASVKVSRTKRRTMTFLSHDEADILLASCNSIITPLILVTLHTGMRFGEVCGLRVRDLALTGDRPTVTVAQAVRRAEPGSPDHIGSPKSASSARTIVLDDIAVSALTEATTGKRADDLVFLNPSTGEFWRHSVFTKCHWNPARASAEARGLTKRPRFHDLRHTHAAWLLSAGVPLLVVSRRLGHDSVGITASTYGHLDPSTDDLVRSALASRADRPALRVVGMMSEGRITG